MFKNLSPGAIGIRGLSLPDAIQLARKAGFQGIDLNIREAATLANEHGLEYVRALFEDAGIVPGQWGLPVVRLKTWNADQWQEDLERLPMLAALGRDLGCTRTTIPCSSGSDEREYAEQYTWVVARYREVTEILREYDCRLGLEFIGPKTSRARYKYEFVYTLEGMMELNAAIGTGNVGLLLDAWHLYTSGGSVDDLDQITADDVVAVHVNDAPPGVALEEQDDHVRGLPMETGVIDLPAFMQKLHSMGYDGPVTPEPFSERINAIASRDTLGAAQLASKYMDRMWRASGLT
jgi:sugar phosphate isomerase/epimerase